MRRAMPATVTLILLMGSVGRGEDWPQFRGPTGQGHAPAGNLPVEWSDTKNVVWKQSIPGKGWSSPVVYERRIYVTTGVPLGDTPNADHSLRALCLDAESGKIVWEQEIFRQNGRNAPRIHRKASHASPTPIVDGRRLYVHFGHQGTACLDLDGNVLWRNNRLKYEPVHGNGGTPILVDDLLVYSADGGDTQFITALDRATGNVRWRTERKTQGLKRFAFSTPLLITVNDERQIISPGAHVVCAYEPHSGREIWRVRYEGYSVIPRPAYGHGLVFICTGYDSPRLLAIRADGRGDVTDTHVAWTTDRAVPHAPSLLLVGDELHMVSDNGVASCLDARTGRPHWQRRLGGNYSASPLYAAGTIYFQSEEGAATVVKAGTEFEQIAKNSFDERTLASYAVADGAIYLRTEQHLYRIQAR